MDPKGIIVALATPLDEDEQVDAVGLRRLIEHVVGAGVHTLLVLGAMGEGPALTDETRSKTVELTREFAGGGATVICGVMEASTQRAIESARAAHRVGADAILGLPPLFYRHGGDAAVTAHLLDLAENAPLPVWLYNTPAQTRTTFSMPMLERLSDHGNIVAMKDSSGDFGYFQQLLAMFKHEGGLDLYQGVGYFLGYSVMMGAAGGVAGLVNLVPRFFAQLYDAALSKDVDRVVQMQNLLLDYRPLVVPGTDMGVALIKAGLEMLGLCGSRATRPFSRIEPERRSRLQGFLDHCRECEQPPA